MKLLSKYLGSPVELILDSDPFCNWPVEKTIESDLDPPILHYVFPERSLEFRCDENGLLTTIFVNSEKLDGLDMKHLGASFSWNRNDVLKELGEPTVSGDPINHPVLGSFGSWVKYLLKDYSIHLEFNLETDLVRRITLMNIIKS